MIVELCTVVHYQGVWDSISADNVSPQEVGYLFLCDPAQCFHLDLFCEIIYHHYSMCSRSCPFGEASIRWIPQ